MGLEVRFYFERSGILRVNLLNWIGKRMGTGIGFQEIKKIHWLMYKPSRVTCKCWQIKIFGHIFFISLILSCMINWEIENCLSFLFKILVQIVFQDQIVSGLNCPTSIMQSFQVSIPSSATCIFVKDFSSYQIRNMKKKKNYRDLIFHL